MILSILWRVKLVVILPPSSLVVFYRLVDAVLILTQFLSLLKHQIDLKYHWSDNIIILSSPTIDRKDTMCLNGDQ